MKLDPTHAPRSTTGTARRAPTRRRRARSLRRRPRGERGMALLLVLLLVVMVSAAGIFAAHAAALDIRSAGYVRQAGQTHYVAEAGVTMSMEEVRRFCSAYLRLMRQSVATAAVPTGLAEPPLTYRFYLEDFNNRTLTSGVFSNPTVAMGIRSEGSLGIGNLQPLFLTTVTVLAQTAQPTVGFDVSGGRNYRPDMLAVEFASEGTTRLAGLSPTTGTANNSVGAEQERVIAQVPCL